VKELNEAKVLAVGPGSLDKDGKRLPMGVQSGDRVLIPQVCRTRPTAQLAEGARARRCFPPANWCAVWRLAC